MAPVSQEDACPVCQTTLSGSEEAKESHVQTCIELHLSAPPTHTASTSNISPTSQTRESEEEGDSCPICHTSYSTKDFDGSDSSREAHFAACFESQSSSSKFAPPPGLPPSNNRAAIFDSKSMSSGAAFPPDKGSASKPGSLPSRDAIMSIQTSTQTPIPTETPLSGSRRFSIFGLGSGKNKEQKTGEKVAKADGLMNQRWGPPGSPTSEMVRRYWKATRMEQHWEYLRGQHPRQFKKYLEKGYMEPIPVRIMSYQSPHFIYPARVITHVRKATQFCCSAKQRSSWKRWMLT